MDSVLEEEYPNIIGEFVDQQASLLEPFGGSKVAYFHSRGYVYSEKTSDRAQLRDALFEARDLDGLVALHDPYEDTLDFNWLGKIFIASKDQYGDGHISRIAANAAICIAYLYYVDAEDHIGESNVEYINYAKHAAEMYLKGHRTTSNARDLGVCWLRKAIELGGDVPISLKRFLPENYLGENVGWTASLLSSHGTDRTSLIRSTLDFGPVYNRFNEVGIPIIGDLLNAGDDPFTNPIHTAANPEAYVPAPGVVAIAGITGTPEGTIKVQAITAFDRPALLLPEDFSLMMALVFCGEPIPGFDLSDICHRDGMLQLLKKSWEPHWICNTAFGKTLYFTDKILGDINWQSGSCLDIVTENAARDPRLHKSSIEFLSRLLEFKKNTPLSRPKGVTAERFSLHAQNKGHDEVFIGRDGTFYTVPLELKPRISWCFSAEDQQGSLNLNDNKFPHGAAANFLTLNYNNLAFTLPIYERYRQLFSLHSSLSNLRDAGFNLNKSIQSELNLLISAHKQRSFLPQARSIVDLSIR